jgi:hypothetical protein
VIKIFITTLNVKNCCMFTISLSFPTQKKIVITCRINFLAHRYLKKKTTPVKIARLKLIKNHFHPGVAIHLTPSPRIFLPVFPFSFNSYLSFSSARTSLLERDIHRPCKHSITFPPERRTCCVSKKSTTPTTNWTKIEKN